MCSLTNGGTTTATGTLPQWATADVQGGLSGALSTYQNATYPTWNGSFQAATDPSVATGMGLTGNAANITSSLPMVSTQSLPQTDLSGYMNPYTSSVVNTTNTQIGNQLAQQQEANDGNAAMSGAFGGDRAGIVNAQTQYNADQLMAQTDAGLNQANYTNAENMAETDLNRNLAAQGENMQGALSANQQALTAGQDLYGEGMGVTQLGQNALNAEINQYQQAGLFPEQMAQAQTQAIGTDTGALNALGTKTTVAPQASTLGTIAGLGTTIAGLGGLLGGSSGLSSVLGGAGLVGLLGGGANGISNTLGLGNIFGSGSGSSASWDGAVPTDYSSGAGGWDGLSLGSFGGGGVVGGRELASGGDIFLACGGLAGYADGGLIDDSSYVPAGTGLSPSTFDDAVSPTQEQLMLYRYTTPSNIMGVPQSAAAPAQPSTGAASTTTSSASIDPVTSSTTSGDNAAGIGLLGLASSGYADGGDVSDSDGGQPIAYDDYGRPIYGPDSAAPQPPPPSTAATAAVNLGAPPQPAAGLAIPAPGAMPDPSAGDVGIQGGQVAAAGPVTPPDRTDISDGSAPMAAPAAVAGSGDIAGDIFGSPDPGSSGGLAGTVPGDGAAPPAGLPGSNQAAPPPAPAASAPGADPNQSRLDRSADPAAALPGGQSMPQGLAAAAPAPGTPGQPTPMAAQSGQPAGAGGSGNSWALPVLAAGLGMLANASPNAGKMIGGGLAGIQTLQQQREAQLRGLQLQNQMNYQNGMLGVRQGQLGVSQQRADTQADAATAKQAYMQQAGQAALQRAQAYAQRMTPGQALNQAAQDMANSSNGQVTYSEAYAYLSGAAARNANAATNAQRAGSYQQQVDQTGSYQQGRLQQGDQQAAIKQQQLADAEANQQRQAQFRANDAEDRQTRSIMFNAAQSGKTISYGQALQQVRSTRQTAGGAPLPQAAPSSASGSPSGGIQDGQTATNPKTGQKMVYRGGQWQTLAQSGY